MQLTSSRRAGVPAWLALLLASLLLPSPAAAQRSSREFTRQGLLVADFAIATGVEVRASKRAGDETRDKAKDFVHGRDVEVIDGLRITQAMERAGYQSDGKWPEPAVRALGVHLRADEYLVGRVDRSDRQGGPAQLSGTLVLMRDSRLRQPLPTATAPQLDDAAAALARSLAAARTQLVHQRRCENALRDRAPAAAIQAARAGIAAYPRATLARTCLIWALRASRARSTEVLAVASEILEVDSMNAHGLEAAAVALDSLRRPAESAPLWLRLAHTDTTDRIVIEQALYSLFDGRNAIAAESLVVKARSWHPDHLPFVQHQWRIAFENRSWARAIAAAEILVEQDTAAANDPQFHRRLATAYRAAGRPYEAVGTLTRGLVRFPREARLYSLYAQYVKEEADTVLPRGLVLFPNHGELLALQARDLRSRGRLAEAVDAMKLAVAVDSTIPDGPLMLAQAEFELGRPDSALVSLRRALAGGGDSTRVAQFAFARGNTLYRAAHGTKSSADFSLGFRFLAFADSVRPSAQSRFLLGLAALGVAQTAFTEAAADSDRTRGCELAQRATTMLPLARISLESVRDVATETVDQSLAHLAQLEPYSATAIKGLCGTARGGP